MLQNEQKAISSNDPRSMGISTDDVNSFFELRKNERRPTQGVRTSTQNLKESLKDQQFPNFSNLGREGLEKELLMSKQRGDLNRIIAVLQAKVRLRGVSIVEKKKVLIDLLLELLNARKIPQMVECLAQNSEIVSCSSEDDSSYFELSFELIHIIVDTFLASQK